MAETAVSASLYKEAVKQTDNSPVSVREIHTGEFSAYTASEAETDSSPTIMANGQKVFDGAIANNCLPFGTKIMAFGKEYIVSDRMNKRYDCSYFDIYFDGYSEAIAFGRRQADYSILLTAIE